MVAGSMFAAASASAAPQPHAVQAASTVLSASAVPAAGMVRPGGPAIHVTSPLTAHGGGLRNAASSTNWSGFATSGATFTTVSASWVEPTAHCTRGRQFSSFWIGLDGFNSGTVEQTGTEVDCSGRTPVYFAWTEFFPAFPVNFPDTVNPGDHFTGSVTSNGGSNFTLRLADTTRGWSHAVTGSVAGAALSSAEVIAEAPSSSSGVLPLANFGTVNFSGATVDGSPIGNFNPTQIIMVNNSGTPKDSVSALGGGTSFSATWLRSN
jgi:hypothetical protein